MTPALQCVLDVKASLGECPVWSVSEQVLYWVDINAPSLNRFDPASGANTTWPMPESIGSFALRMGGGFVVALRSAIWFASRDGKLERKVVDAPYDPAHHRFNDGRADAQGRFWAGSMNEQRDVASAKLYRLDADLSLHTAVEDITISNGLAFSPDGRTMYHADTMQRTIWSYAVDPGSAALSARRVFAQFEGATDRPDGGAVDREGCYWSAFYRGGKIVRLSPKGELLAEHAVPSMCPTMCALGGPEMQTLYVTSARQQRDDAELARLPQSGGIFAMHVDVPGQVEPKFVG
ncbi:MAG: SMP-30/gluconolactonase/LRE family protein [Betaproteobacteria bacterium]